MEASFQLSLLEPAARSQDFDSGPSDLREASDLAARNPVRYEFRHDRMFDIPIVPTMH